jgi:hypothetical protein
MATNNLNSRKPKKPLSKKAPAKKPESLEAPRSLSEVEGPDSDSLVGPRPDDRNPPPKKA